MLLALIILFCLIVSVAIYIKWDSITEFFKSDNENQTHIEDPETPELGSQPILAADDLNGDNYSVRAEGEHHGSAKGLSIPAGNKPVVVPPTSTTAVNHSTTSSNHFAPLNSDTTPHSSSESDSSSEDERPSTSSNSSTSQIPVTQQRNIQPLPTPQLSTTRPSSPVVAHTLSLDEQKKNFKAALMWQKAISNPENLSKLAPQPIDHYDSNWFNNQEGLPAELHNAHQGEVQTLADLINRYKLFAHIFLNSDFTQSFHAQHTTDGHSNAIINALGAQFKNCTDFVVGEAQTASQNNPNARSGDGAPQMLVVDSNGDRKATIGEGAIVQNSDGSRHVNIPAIIKRRGYYVDIDGDNTFIPLEVNDTVPGGYQVVEQTQEGDSEKIIINNENHFVQYAANLEFYKFWSQRLQVMISVLEQLQQAKCTHNGQEISAEELMQWVNSVNLGQMQDENNKKLTTAKKEFDAKITQQKAELQKKITDLQEKLGEKFNQFPAFKKIDGTEEKLFSATTVKTNCEQFLHLLNGQTQYRGTAIDLSEIIKKWTERKTLTVYNQKTIKGKKVIGVKSSDPVQKEFQEFCDEFIAIAQEVQNLLTQEKENGEKIAEITAEGKELKEAVNRFRNMQIDLNQAQQISDEDLDFLLNKFQTRGVPNQVTAGDADPLETQEVEV